MLAYHCNIIAKGWAPLIQEYFSKMSVDSEISRTSWSVHSYQSGCPTRSIYRCPGGCSRDPMTQHRIHGTDSSWVFCKELYLLQLILDRGWISCLVSRVPWVIHKPRPSYWSACVPLLFQSCQLTGCVIGLSTQVDRWCRWAPFCLPLRRSYLDTTLKMTGSSSWVPCYRSAMPVHGPW